MYSKDIGRRGEWIADDLRALNSKAESSEEVRDHYLADWRRSMD
jgi:hypothetical protein